MQLIDEQQIKPKKITLEVVIIMCLVIGALLLFAYIANEAVIEKEKTFDDAVIGFFDSITSTSLINVMKVFTFLGSTGFLIPTYVALITWYLVRKNYIFSIYIALITIGGTLLFWGLKQIFQRQRPLAPVIKGVTGYSFPSGHSLSTFVFSSILIYIIWHSNFKLSTKWILAILLSLFSVTVGISRVILKVHYPTDVLASFCVGIVWVIVCLAILQKINKAKSSLK
jgi:undecaprenyl-diphosphatase